MQRTFMTNISQEIFNVRSRQSVESFEAESCIFSHTSCSELIDRLALMIVVGDERDFLDLFSGYLAFGNSNFLRSALKLRNCFRS